MANELEKTAKNIGDAVKEGVHRGSAEAEREKRADFGETMTGGQKAESVVNEVEQEAKAGVDRLKRDVRNL